MIVCAPLSSRLVARFGTRRVVTAGMLLFAHVARAAFVHAMARASLAAGAEHADH
jgi:hypothetical protein